MTELATKAAKKLVKQKAVTFDTTPKVESQSTSQPEQKTPWHNKAPRLLDEPTVYTKEAGTLHLQDIKESAIAGSSKMCVSALIERIGFFTTDIGTYCNATVHANHVYVAFHVFRKSPNEPESDANPSTRGPCQLTIAGATHTYTLNDFKRVPWLNPKTGETVLTDLAVMNLPTKAFPAAKSLRANSPVIGSKAHLYAFAPSAKDGLALYSSHGIITDVIPDVDCISVGYTTTSTAGDCTAPVLNDAGHLVGFHISGGITANRFISVDTLPKNAVFGSAQPSRS